MPNWGEVLTQIQGTRIGNPPEAFEKNFGECYIQNMSFPDLPTRLMVGIHSLKGLLNFLVAGDFYVRRKGW